MNESSPTGSGLLAVSWEALAGRRIEEPRTGEACIGNEVGEAHGEGECLEDLS